jgi:hypothetical protein
MSGFVHIDTKGIAKSFSDLLANVKKSDVFHNENNGNGNGNGNGNADEITEPNFREYLDNSTLPIIPTSVETASDVLKSGSYGDGTWNDDYNSYTLGASDTLSFMPNTGYALEISIALADTPAVTKIILPNETYSESSENAVVTLKRVQTPPLEDANGDDLGVYTLTASTHLESAGDLLAKRGCTNDKATNYADNAKIDDGSCVLPEWYEKIPTWAYAVGGLGIIAMMVTRR